MNKGRKLQQALELSSKASRDILDLRVVMARMSTKQRDEFTHLAQGYDELETFVETNRMGELAGKIPVVTTKTGQTIRTTSIKTIADLDMIEPSNRGALEKVAKDHVAAAVGNQSYGTYLEQMQFLFQVLAPNALANVWEISEDKKNPPPIRLKASLAILDRAGFRAQAKPENRGLPVRVILNMPKFSTPTPEAN